MAPQPFLVCYFGPLIGCTVFCAMFTLTFELTSVYMLYYPLSARACAAAARRVRLAAARFAAASCLLPVRLGQPVWAVACVARCRCAGLLACVPAPAGRACAERLVLSLCCVLFYVQRGIKVTLHILIACLISQAEGARTNATGRHARTHARTRRKQIYSQEKRVRLSGICDDSRHDLRRSKGNIQARSASRRRRRERASAQARSERSHLVHGLGEAATRLGGELHQLRVYGMGRGESSWPAGPWGR